MLVYVIDSGLSAPPVGFWRKAHWGLLLVALVVLVVAGQGQHFFNDEWAFVGGKLDAVPFPDRYLQSHNEHWILLPLMAYRTLGATVGVGSYWPYLGLLLLLHLSVTHVLWRLMLVTGSRPIVATSLAAIFSVLGAGAEDLVWAFQIGFVGSTLLGVTAVYLAVTGGSSMSKTFALAGLITAGLATSGIGMTYLLIVPFVLAQRRRRYAVVALCLPLVVYAAWHSRYAESLTHPPNASATVPLMIGAFVALGLTSALTRSSGFAMDGIIPLLIVGVPILAGIAVTCRGWIADKTLAGRTALAMCLGAVAFFGSTGLARGGLGIGAATPSRYVYVAMAMVLPAVALIVTHGVDQHPRLTRTVIPVALAMAVANVFQLLVFAAETRRHNDASRRVLVASSDLLTSGMTIFADQRPEPFLAPDLTAADLRSRHLDTAFETVIPELSDHLTASLNLQIQVAPNRDLGATSACRTILEQRITVRTSQETPPSFRVTADGPVAFTLHNAGSHSAERVIVLTKGTYRIRSERDDIDLTIEPESSFTAVDELLTSQLCVVRPQPASADRGLAR